MRILEKRRRLFHELYEVLERTIGPTHWWPAETPFEVCIGAILTQNAPWTGVVRAIAALKDMSVFDAVSIAEADDRVIAEAVRPTIYYNQKARRLRVFCRFLLDNYHGDVENMADLDLADARKKLLALPGIGYETADSMLLYALGKPIFVVDAYTKRIFARHGLAEPSWDYEELRGYFEDALDPDPVFYGEFHGLICLLGAGVCRRKPLCDKCPLYSLLGKPVV